MSNKEKLAKALEAYTDNMDRCGANWDYNQWFTNGKDWILCDREDWMDMYSVLCCGKGHDYQYELDKYHKATPDELIEHFNKPSFFARLRLRIKDLLSTYIKII